MAPEPSASHISVSPANIRTESPSAGTTEHDSELVPAPMSNLYNLTESTNPQTLPSTVKTANVDFIGQGAISITEAEQLYSHYREFINPLLWAGILCPHRTLHQARQSSSLLVAAVLTVAALHSPSRKETLPIAYENFVSLVKDACLSRCRGLDDIRGLCIGAFYLTNLSWRLCAQAVRMATEHNLHQAGLHLHKGPLDFDTHERVRLWYVIYVCDHQFAIAYGRPPSMQDDFAVQNTQKFLRSQHAINGDVRLIAQVDIFRILAEAYSQYGCDPELVLSDLDFEKLRSLNIAIDQWRLTYQSKSVDMPTYGTYPSKGTVLYYHFARFQLNSLSLRNILASINTDEASSMKIGWDRREAAQIAISAAMNTLKLVVEEADLRKALVGVPIFTHAMISMSASTLLKIAVVFGQLLTSMPPESQEVRVSQDLSRYGLTYYTSEALGLVKELVGVLNEAADKVSNQHLASHIVAGLRELVQRFKADGLTDSFIYSRTSQVSFRDAANLVLVPSQPVSRLWNHRDQVAQQQQTGDLNLGTDQARDEGGLSSIFEPFPDRGMASMIGSFDWGFDDTLLWQVDNEKLYY